MIMLIIKYQHQSLIGYVVLSSIGASGGAASRCMWGSWQGSWGMFLNPMQPNKPLGQSIGIR